MTPVKTSRFLSCPHCHLTVARPSHLTRHLQSHLPPARREHFSCVECGRQFSRNDVLLRHLRTAHQAYVSRKRSAQKSCFRCVKKKLKCDRAHPCLPCTKSSNSCLYPGEDASPEDEVLEGKAESSPPTEGQYQEEEICQNNSFSTAGSYQHDSQSQLPLGQATSGFLQDTARRSVGVPAFNDDTHFYQSAPDPMSLEMIPPEMVSYPTTSPTNAGTDFSQPIMGFENPYLSNEYNFMSSNSAPRIVGMAEGGVDWLSLELDSPNNGELPPQSLGHLYSTEAMQLMTGPPSMPGIPEDAMYNRMNQTIPARFDQIRGQDSNRSSAKPSEAQAAAQQWPFDHTRHPEPQNYRLPPLRDILQGTTTSSEHDSAITIKSLGRLLSSSPLNEVDASQDLGMRSAWDLVKNSLELYFQEFHSVLPLVHRPTFDMSRVPTVTLVAMSCIGAMYSDDRQGTEQSASLSDMCIQMIAWLGGSDSTNFYNPAYLIACCLHQIYSLGSGNRRLYQNADCSRGILIGCLRGMGILKSRVSTEMEKDDAKNILSVDNAATEWLRWKDQEEEKRIAWSSFEYDCSLCTLTSRRGAVDLPELPSLLPCAEPLWDAPSAQAWMALYSRLSTTARGSPTSKVLRNLLAGKAISGDVPAWSKRLCAQIIGRLLWDLKQLDIMATPAYLKLPSLSHAQRQTKGTLLQGLSTICESMYSPTTTAELIHYNITSLICHYSHLYSADEAMDLIVHIFRTSATQSNPPDQSLLSAKRRLESLLAKNPCKARELAWHAAQIVAVANEYLVSAPCEIMRVFMGYIFILAFAKFGPQPPPEAGFEPCLVRLDLSNRLPGQLTAIKTWIDVGGPASIGMVTNIYSDGGLKAISHEAQSMLRKLRYWGLAKKFIRILESFELTD